MISCRYFPECQRCNEVGDSWIPCSGGSDGIQCDAYEPMPDVDALLALADECDSVHMHKVARRIREACGVVDAG